ncbi:MAG: polysaccharide deacetylase family protein [Vicingaceae bacterium]
MTAKSSTVVLCFHVIGNTKNIIYPAIPIDVFTRLLNYVERNFEIVPLQKIKEPLSSKKPRLVLSFDDGDWEFMTNVLPLLKSREIPSVQSIITESADTGKIPWPHRYNGLMESKMHEESLKEVVFESESFKIRGTGKNSIREVNRLFQRMLIADPATVEVFLNDLSNEAEINASKMMDWESIRLCLKSDVEIASHTTTHSILTSIQSEDQLSDEIVGSKKILEKQLGTSINAITFPNGKYNNKIVDECRKAGYEWLLGTEVGFVKDHSTVLPRIPMNSTSFYELVFKIYRGLWPS